MPVPVLGQFIFFNRTVLDVLFMPYHEEHLTAVPDIEQGEIIVEPIGYDNAPFK